MWWQTIKRQWPRHKSKNKLKYHHWFHELFDPRSNPAKLQQEHIVVTRFGSTADIIRLVKILNKITHTNRQLKMFKDRKITLTWYSASFMLTICIERGPYLAWILPRDTCMTFPHTVSDAQWQIERFMRDFYTQHRSMMTFLFISSFFFLQTFTVMTIIYQWL